MDRPNATMWVNGLALGSPSPPPPWKYLMLCRMGEHHRGLAAKVAG